MIDIVVLTAVCFGGPLLVCLACSGQWASPRAILLCAAAYAVVTTNILVVGLAPSVLPTPSVMAALHWNWIGKAAAVAASLIMFALLPRDLKDEAGVTALMRPVGWKSLFAVSAGLVAFFWAVAYMQRSGGGWKGMGETIAFQGLMPGLDEELAFRGVTLALLVAAFGKPWRIAGIGVGWGALPLIAFFGLAHGYTSLQTGLNWLTIAITGVAGAGLLWLKERTGSIWLPVVVHNLMNVGSELIGKL